MNLNALGLSKVTRQYLYLLIGMASFYGVFFLMASPNYQRYHRKSPQAEAKLQLAILFSYEKSFEAENRHYSEDLTKIGFRPEGQLRYVVGFSEKCRRGSEILNTLQNTADQVQAKFIFSETARGKIEKVFSELPCAVQFPERWEAYAVGDIGGEKLDIWKMSDQKELTSIQDGLPTGISRCNLPMLYYSSLF